MYCISREETSKRRRRKSRKPRIPRRQPLPPLGLDYFHSRDKAFFDANPGRTYSARRVDDEEIAALLWERHGRASQSYRFAHWFTAPNECPWAWRLACKIDRADGVISRCYIASGCDDYTNYKVTAIEKGGQLETAGETVAVLLWEAARRSARSYPYLEEHRYYRIPAHLQEGGRA